MIPSMKTIFLIGLLVLTLGAVACAAGREASFAGLASNDAAVEDEAFSRNSRTFGLDGFPGNPGLPGPAGAPAMPTPAPFPPAPPMAPAPVPAPAAPAPQEPLPSAEFYTDTLEQSGAGGGFGITEDRFKEIIEGESATENEVALVAQQRIIVRTVDMQLVVVNVADSIDDISNTAVQFGGWVVNSDRSSKHRGLISIRVPANRLDEAIEVFRNMAVEIDSETSTSQDVTDEYVDSQSRLTSLTATEQALIKLLDQARTVEEALDVQRELSRLQADIESLQGRIKFLEETAAFSRVNIGLRLAPADMNVDAGEDKTYSVGQFARFRATFEPPEGIEDFTFTWDFGDGTGPVSGRGTAPTPDGKRITATVNHTYFDDRDSPFIVEVEITGTGDAGIAEGSDTFIATVTKLPTIEVFAGENRAVEEGEQVEYEGSFTRPEGLRDIKYAWNFGDGTPNVEGVPEDGVTQALTEHTYSDHRPFPYTATLTITADSDAGEVEASSSFNVFVTEREGLVVSGWSAGDTGRTAVRTLSGVGQAVGTLIIWLAIFSPVWLIIGGVIYVLRGRVRLRMPRRSRTQETEAN